MGSWCRQGGHRQWPGSKERHIPTLRERNRHSYISKCPSQKKSIFFYTYIQHLSSSPAVE